VVGSADKNTHSRLIGEPRREERGERRLAVARVFLSLAWSRLDDVVDAQQHLSGLGSRHEDLVLDVVRLSDAELLHVADAREQDVEACVAVALGVRGAHLAHELGAVEACVVGEDRGDGAQCASKCLQSKCLLASSLHKRASS